MTEMYPGIARFCAYWRGAEMLQQTFEALTTAIDENNDSCIDAAKCIVECACQILIRNLDDVSNPIREWKDSPIKSETPSFRQWVSAAFQLLKLTEYRDDPFAKIVSQHFKLVHELGKFRNLAGPVSHGRDGFVQKLSVHHRRASVIAADALITFMHNAYLELAPDPVTTLEPYERFSQSNALIDQYVEITESHSGDGCLSVAYRLPDGDVRELTVEPSRLLFTVDRVAYKEALDQCRNTRALPNNNSDFPACSG